MAREKSGGSEVRCAEQCSAGLDCGGNEALPAVRWHHRGPAGTRETKTTDNAHPQLQRTAGVGSLICLLPAVSSRIRVWVEVDSLSQGLSSRRPTAAQEESEGSHGNQAWSAGPGEKLHRSPIFPSLASPAPHAWLTF